MLSHKNYSQIAYWLFAARQDGASDYAIDRLTQRLSDLFREENHHFFPLQFRQEARGMKPGRASKPVVTFAQLSHGGLGEKGGLINM